MTEAKSYVELRLLERTTLPVNCFYWCWL